MSKVVSQVIESFPCKALIFAGLIKGFVGYHKFGRTPNAPLGQRRTVWDDGTNQDFPYSKTLDGDKIYLISSTDAGDAGMVVRVEGVTSAFVRKAFNVTLDVTNATTAVALPYAMMIIDRMEIMSGTAQLGDITLKHSDGTVIAKIQDSAAKYGQTQMALFAVPDGYYGFVETVGRSVNGNKEVEINYRAKPFGEIWKTKRPIDLYNQSETEGNLWFFFPAKTILDATALPAQLANISIWFDIILIKKEEFERRWGVPSGNIFLV